MAGALAVSQGWTLGKVPGKCPGVAYMPDGRRVQESTGTKKQVGREHHAASFEEKIAILSCCGGDCAAEPCASIHTTELVLCEWVQHMNTLLMTRFSVTCTCI